MNIVIYSQTHKNLVLLLKPFLIKYNNTGGIHMEAKSYRNTVKVLVIITFILMIAANALANTLPLNGITTGDVSLAYDNLFAPAGITFAIWGVIYVVLAAFTLYQAGWLKDHNDKAKDKLLNKVGILFSISSLANTAWIFAWHYDLIALSLLFMLTILICLICINGMMVKEKLTNKEKWLVRMPFMVYHGWITVAAIANITVFLVSMGWNGFGISESVWAVIMIAAGAVIGSLTAIAYKSVAYLLVLIWAYIGILIKHASADGFALRYTGVIATVIICIALLIGISVYVFDSIRKMQEK